MSNPTDEYDAITCHKVADMKLGYSGGTLCGSLTPFETFTIDDGSVTCLACLKEIRTRQTEEVGKVWREAGIPDVQKDMLEGIAEVDKLMRKYMDNLGNIPKLIAPVGMTVEPVYDYELKATHHFKSAVEVSTDWEEDYDPRHYQEKVVWVFVCRRTGKIVEVVHTGPLDKEDLKGDA